MPTYQFKNPKTNEWVEIVATAFHLALKKFRALIKTS